MDGVDRGTAVSERGELVRHWRTRLDSALDGAAVPTAGELDTPPVITRFSLFHMANRCPASALVEDRARFDAEGNFVEAVFTATREVALVALSVDRADRADHVRSHTTGIDPHEMVERALAGPRGLRDGVGRWVRELDRAGAGALRSAAVSWVLDALALAARRGEPEWQSPRLLEHTPGGRGVTLTAGIDALRSTEQGRHLMTVRSSAGATDKRVAARIALLWVLVRGEVPASVVLGFRDSLQRRRFDVDEEVLDRAIDDAVVDITRAQRPSTAPRDPGPGCRRCSLSRDCPPGIEWVGSQPRSGWVG